MKFAAKKTDLLINVLSDFFRDTTKTKIKKIISSGLIFSGNTKLTKATTTINQGTVLQYIKDKQLSVIEGFPYPIIYEDDYLIAIDKPAGVVTHGLDSIKNPSLLKTVNNYIKDKTKGKKNAYIIHRLDREVSGVILIAKSKTIMQAVKSSWSKTEKIYYALVEGLPEISQGVLSSWLIEGEQQKMKSVPKCEGAKFTVTNYRTVANYGEYTLLEVSLETGRKNQIRVHLSEMGHPIVGDRKYGADTTFVRQIRLHSYSLKIIHPVTGKEVLIQSKLPKKFLILKNENEKY